jgi:hypothetical protein
MEVKIENQKLKITIDELNDLLNERLTLGTKNRVQKIIKKLAVEFEPFNKLHIELLEKHGAQKFGKKIGFENDNAPEAFLIEFQEIGSQTSTINFDPIDFSFLEQMETTKNYKFELLAPFFENFEA